MVTMAEVLRIPPLDRCSVVAGGHGLTRSVQSVNSFDAPDVVPWFKAGELVLTTGYVFKNDEAAQIELVQAMAERNCAGLGIKVNHFLSELPDSLLQVADDHDLPLLEIPYDVPISDLVFPLLREIFAFQRQHKAQNRQETFFAGLLQGKWLGRDAILAQGRDFGLLPGYDYICLCIHLASSSVSEGQSNVRKVTEILHAVREKKGVTWWVSEWEGTVIIIQISRDENKTEFHIALRQLARKLAEEWNVRFPEDQVMIGIGTYHDDVLGISTSYKNAQEAVRLGWRVAPSSENTVYEYAALKPYSILQEVPDDILQSYVEEVLTPLIRYDREKHANLLETLEAYLGSGGRPSVAARNLGVHRNTVNFRLGRIKDLLGVDLDDGETTFRLQLAFHAIHLL
ncbi:PucR family transcriptional regulator [Kroppenstedtia pulmonis]|uniref:PucR family transcriptional regulator n=1 Tax=Kroppenstedtia pulmonis TaxID=1380685 RepID=A0A7D4C729_9BACL|nr:PucR family transcriptional regulator ligand-binding domain-containing protein [Kroppenstedtia pulmonis]QKG84736.1 PucR family transcriptional regulator [Kroppenstedtia pulmonis]